MQRLLYFYPHPSGFIQKDLDLLAPHYDVRSLSFSVGSKWSTPFRFLHQLAFLARYIFSSSVIVCRFAGWHSVLPVLAANMFRKPSLIIIGGTEAHFFPSIGYGNSTRRWYGWATGLSLRKASRIAPVDESLVRYDYSYDQGFPAKQGMFNIYENLDTPVSVIHNGYDATAFHALPGSERMKNSFLTVANCSQRTEFYLKGIDLVLEAAARRPSYSFTVAGRAPGWVRREDHPNVRFAGPAGHGALLKLFSSHAFYLQLSIAEGFPNALCEAMLCECVPVGSAVFSIPKIIGDTGFVVEKRSVDHVIRALDDAVECDRETLSRNAREKITANYPLSLRTEKLLAVLAEIQT